MANPSFQYSKERVFIAEAFFNENHNLSENDQRELITLIKDVGSSRMFRSRPREREGPERGQSSWFSISTIKSLFVSKERTSMIVEDAARRSREVRDLDFLATLPEKVLGEPLLEQFAQEAMNDAYVHFREFMKQRLPRLYSRAHEIRQQSMHRQVELGEKKQDQERRAAMRSDWINEIRTAQTQMHSRCVLYYPWMYLNSFKVCLNVYFSSQAMVFIHSVEEIKQGWMASCMFSNPLTPITYLTFNSVQACC